MDILTTHAQEHMFRDVLGIEMPTSSVGDELRETTRVNGKKSLYYFTTAVLQWDRVRRVPHLEMCSFIQNVEPPHKRRKVLLIPRDCFKSTVGSKSFPLWILIQDNFCGLPGLEHRILLCSFSSVNAQKQIKSLAQQVERNEMLRWLYPEIVPDLAHTTWTSSNLLFPREGRYGEDTIEAAGVDTHIVSRHYTIQIKDDLEDKQSFEQPSVRERVKTFYKSAEALFVDEREAYDLLIGTRWGLDDVYNDIKEHEFESYEFQVRPLHWRRDDLERDFREAKEFSRPPTYGMDPDTFAPDASKTYYFFPELFPEESCVRIARKQGTFMYSMLYMNNPKDPSLAEIKGENLISFTFDSHGDLLFKDDEDRFEVVPFDSLFRVLFWDPALSEREQKKNSRNAMVVVGMDSKRRFFVLDAYAEYKNPAFLYSKFIGMHKRFLCNKAVIESVAFQRILKYPIYAMQEEHEHHFPITDDTPIGDKDARIRTLIPLSESRRFFVRHGLTDLREEATSFPVSPKKDLVDAVAAAITHCRKAKGASQNSRHLTLVQSEPPQRSAVTGY